jgi:CelD/BcsL family acetyltransferase involved in cellulose biosynthesis
LKKNAGMIDCRVLSDETEIEALAPSWRLLRDEAALSPYSGPDEALLWWRKLGKPAGQSLLVAVCFDEGKLVGVIPCAVQTRAGVRVLYLLGHDVFYYRSFLFAHARYVDPLWKALLAAKGYDIACLKNIHDNSEDMKALLRFSKPFQESRASFHSLQKVVKTELFAGYPKSLRRRLRRVQDQIDSGDIVIENSFDQKLPEEAVDFLVAQKTTWAKEHGLKGIFTTNEGPAFFKELVQLVVSQKRASFFWMKWKGKIVASSYSLAQKNTLYAHLAAYNPAASSLGPGMVLTAHESAWAVANGYEEINFMEGEEEYKNALSNGHRVIYDFLVARSFKGLLYRWVYGLLMWLRRSRGKA